MKFQELTDHEWEFIKPLLPLPASTGRPRADDRRTVNAIIYVLTTGCKWEDIPKEYGSYSTAWRRLKILNPHPSIARLSRQKKGRMCRI